MQANQPNQDPTQRFLISAIANVLRALLTPVYYAIRSDMGVQYSALPPLLVSAFFYGGAWTAIASVIGFNNVNSEAIAFYFLLIAIGFFRNMAQARHRRRVRDWRVGSWSTGRSLLEPLIIMSSRFIYRKWGGNRAVCRMLPIILTDDFIFYVAEPGILILSAPALFSIGATLYLYPILLAIALICVRNDRQLYIYLKAHEIADGQMMERAVRSEFEGSGNGKAVDIPVVQIPEAPTGRLATDGKSVFNRLSPELQMLLAHGKDTQP